MSRILIVCFLLSTSLFGQGSRTLELGIFHTPPFFDVQNGQEVQGLCFSLLQDILRIAKVPYKVKVYPTPRLYKYLSKGQTHIIFGSKNVHEYEDDVIFSPDPIFTVELAIYHDKNKVKVTNIRGLKGKRVHIIHGYSFGGLIDFLKNPKNEIQLGVSMKHSTAWKILENRRTDYLIDYYLTTHNIHKLEESENITYSIIQEIPMYLIISKKVPDAQKVMNRMVKAWKKIQGKGDHSGLKQ